MVTLALRPPTSGALMPALVVGFISGIASVSPDLHQAMEWCEKRMLEAALR